MASVTSSNTLAHNIWTENGLPQCFLEELHLSDKPDPAVNSSFKLGAVAQTAIGLAGLSAAYFHHLNTGVRQSVSVEPRHAILEFRSEGYWLLDDKKLGGDLLDELAGLYRTEDGFVRIHTNFPHHKQGILDILQCKPTRESIQTALLQWDSQEFEDEAARRNMCATKTRTFEDWDKHPHAVALRTTPPVQLIKVGEAPKRDLHRSAASPLSGIRALDLTRVLAGPVAGRTLAAYGADVLFITSPQLPDLPFLDKDTSRGKRTTQLNLGDEVDRETLRNLVKETDVFLQAYRPGGLHEKSFGVQDMAEVRPGIVYASLRAYGWEGPWKERRGFDSLIQNATGFGFAEAQAFESFKGVDNGRLSPRPLPCQAIDHAAGYFLAFGINSALCKTITEGGSWEVRVSLAGVAQWIRSLGQLDPQSAFGVGRALPSGSLPWPDELVKHSVQLRQSKPDSDSVADEGKSARNPRMTAIRHAAKLSWTPAREGEAPLGLNIHQAEWLDRKE